jgi:hypothetical protein
MLRALGGGSVTAMRSEIKAGTPGMARCPGCGALSWPDSRGFCPACGAWLAGPQAAELRWIAAQLARLDEARRWLVARRATLLAELTPEQRPGATGLPGDQAGLRADQTDVGADAAVTPKRPGAGRRVGSRPELSRAAAANLLLAAGGVLVVFAAAAFTAANWSVISAGGRAAILFAMALFALAAPWPLTRRGLTATAESVAAIGLALTAAATYLVLLQVPAGPVGGLGLASAACAVLAVAWGAYGVVGPPRGPMLAAIALAQFPVPLAAAAVARSAPAVALALVLTAAADLVGATWAGRKTLHAVQTAAQATRVSAAATWLCGVLLANAVIVGDLAPRQPFLLSAAFAAAAVTAFFGATVIRARPLAGWVTAASGALAAIALALPAAAASAVGWRIGAFAVAGAAVAGAAGCWAPYRTRKPGRARQVAAGGTSVFAIAGLLALPAGLYGLVYPLGRLSQIWPTPRVFPHAGLAPASAWHVAPATAGVLALAALAFWWMSAPNWSWLRAAAPACAGLAAGSLAVAAGVTGLAALITMTGMAALLLGAGSLVEDRVAAGAASVTGLVVAGSAALWTLTGLTFTFAGWSPSGPAVTIAELSVLAVCLAGAGVMARSVLPAILTAAAAVAVLAGLACAVMLSRGLPAREAAFAVLAVAAGAAGTATLLRRARPVQALTVDLCAGALAVLAAAMAAQRTDTFSLLTMATAAIASTTAWMRAGLRRTIALAVAGLATVTAIGSQARPLVLAASLPYHRSFRPWHAQPGGLGWPALGWPGLPLAMMVLAVCAATAVAAAGAWRGSRGSLDALALAMPVVAAPAAGAAAGLGYARTAGLLLAFTLALTGWAAAGRSLAPAGAALAAAPLTLVWAVAAPPPTLLVLGCLTAAYAACAWRARLPGVRIGAASLAVISGGALAGCSALAAGLPGWQAGLAVLGSAATAQLIAALPANRRTGTAAAVRAWAVELSGWLTAATGVAISLGRPQHASIALAVAGGLCLGVAARPSRRALLWAGLALAEAALCVWLAVLGVHAPEPYTVPAAAILIAFGRHHWRGSPGSGSWASYGPGLALLLLPSLTVAWQEDGWLRPLLLGVAAAMVTLAGGRARLRAPLLLGAAVMVLDAGHELAPAISQLVGMLPRWVPIAVIGVVLLGVGSTYEARLRDLNTLRRAVARLR